MGMVPAAYCFRMAFAPSSVPWQTPGTPGRSGWTGQGGALLARVGVRVVGVPVYKHVKLELGASRPRPAATPRGHGLGRCWAGDSAARGCGAVDRCCSSPRTRPALSAGGARRSRSGGRGIRSEWSARSARPRRLRSAPVVGGPHAGDAQTRQLTVKVAAIDSIPVVDEVVGRQVCPPSGRACFAPLRFRVTASNKGPMSTHI